MPLRIPNNLSNTYQAHAKWLDIVTEAQNLIEEDIELQDKAAQGLHLKERNLPPEVLGKFYAQYCALVNKLYDAYLNNVHLQRAPYILEIVSVFIKRLYELRNELVHVIVNDYIYVDTALKQLRMTPADIQIVVPYHLPLEAREDTIEHLLQKMWSDAAKRKKRKEKPAPPPVHISTTFDEGESDQALPVQEPLDEESEEEESEKIVHTIIPEKFIHVVNIQRIERFRSYFMKDFKAKCSTRRMYFAHKGTEVSLQMKNLAASLIQKVYREYMNIKRQHCKDFQRDLLLGLLPDPFKHKRNFDQENNKIYAHRREIRSKLHDKYLEELNKENIRIMVFKKDNQIDDITEHILEWFKEWYYGYGFFPDYPYEVEGGTVLVIRGDFNTIEDQIKQDEILAAASKGKSPETIKNEKARAKADAKLKLAAQKQQKIKEAEQLLKLRTNPFEDPGYQPQQSECLRNLLETLQNYRSSWSVFDRFPPDKCGDTIYGYIKPLLTEDLMCEVHKDCRRFVDEMMRIDLKLLIKAHQIMYKRVGWKYPNKKPRKKPKNPKVPRSLEINDKLKKGFETIFDLGIITRPTTKLKDVLGDFNYAASELNVQDPYAIFPLPGYGDVKRRLVLSCVFGSGIECGAKRNKAVMLVGPKRNGKSFLADAVADAIKIDITPKVFSAELETPAKVLNQVFLAARAFQPAVIFMRNVEKVFCKKVTPEDIYLKAKSLKTVLPKLLKSLPADDKVIFIATCSDPLSAQTIPMASIFNEIILVPRTDYGTLQQFFYHKFQRLKSMPRDYCVQPIAQMLQGYGFGVIIEAFNNIMTPERIVKLNVTELSPLEVLEELLDSEYEPLTLEDYQVYVDFFINNSPLNHERKDYEIINNIRAVTYQKMRKAEEKHAQ